MRIPVDNLGSVGLVKDIFNEDIPPEAWTSLQNSRTGPYGLEKFLGHSRTLGTDVTGIAQQPLWMQYVPKAGGTGFWLMLGTTAVKARLGASPYTETDITRAAGAYTASANTKWHGDVFGSLAILNNAVDEPQAWPTVSGATLLVNLSSIGTGPWPANYRAGVLRPYGRFLVAADITKGATRYPQLVKWSHEADPGAFPVSWDPTDITKDAGEFPMADATGAIVDMRVLRDVNVLYTTDQVWAMRWVGGGDVMGFSPLFHEQGALATNCVTSFKKGTEFHLVLGGDDIFVHNGQAPNSILEPNLRRWFFSQIDPSVYMRSFVVANPLYSEVWVCIPEAGTQQPTLALVWNWQTGTIGFRDLLKLTSNGDTRTGVTTQGTPSIAEGHLEDVSLDPWSGDSAAWDTDTTVWNQQNSNPATPRLLMADRSAGNRVFLLDSGATFDTTSIPWLAERVGLSIIGHDRQGNPKNDASIVKQLTEIWPKIDAPAGTVVNVNVGFQDRPEDSVSWSPTFSYTVGTSLMLPVFGSGRYLSVRFSATVQGALRAVGYGLEIEPSGEF